MLAVAASVAATFQGYALISNGINETMPLSNNSLQFSDYLQLASIITYIHIGAQYFKGINHIFNIYTINNVEDVLSVTILYLSIISILIVIVLFAMSTLFGKYVIEKIYFAYFAIVILLSSLYKCRYDMVGLLYENNSSRYFLIPSIMLVWLIVLMLKDNKLKYASIVLITSMIITARYDFVRKPLNDYNWPACIGKAKVDPNFKIPINPPGWSVNMRCDVPN
jgi:hypothetical protein